MSDAEKGYLGIWWIIGAICGTFYVMCTTFSGMASEAFDCGLILGLILFALLLIICFCIGGFIGGFIGMAAGVILALIYYLIIKMSERISNRWRIINNSISLKNETISTNRLIKRRKKLMARYSVEKIQINRIAQLVELLCMVEESENIKLMNDDLQLTIQELDEINLIEKRILDLGNKYLSAGNRKMAEYYHRQVKR